MWEWIKYSYRVWFGVLTVQIINFVLVLAVVVITALFFDLLWHITG